MSADFWAGYVSGAIGILVGNPLDLIKTRLQARTGTNRDTIAIASNNKKPINPPNGLEHFRNLARGAAAPILGYGGLNALLFVTYNRSLALLRPNSTDGPIDMAPAWCIWNAGALGGLATFVVSAPTELIKCRAQVSNPPRSSLDIARRIWIDSGFKGFYTGGVITSIRDAVGYGFYFWSYELSKRAIAREDDSPKQSAVKILFCGGLAGVVTWASIFPLDVLKTRVQTWDLVGPRLSTQTASRSGTRPSVMFIAKEAHKSEGFGVFFRGLGICGARAFIVNAVQWTVYEWMMKVLAP